jgi:hypothetical protein
MPKNGDVSSSNGLAELEGIYEPSTRSPYLLLCLTRRRCAFDRMSGTLMYRLYPGDQVIEVIDELSCG